MNKVILMGRLTRDPEVRYSQGNNSTIIAHYTLAVDRRYRTDNEETADFISCIAFGKAAEFAEKYLKKGIKIAIAGRIQTGSYTNRDGNRVYTTDVVVEEQEFAESKSSNSQTGNGSREATNGSSSRNSANGSSLANGYRTRADGFIDMDGLDEEMPFN